MCAVRHCAVTWLGCIVEHLVLVCGEVVQHSWVLFSGDPNTVLTLAVAVAVALAMGLAMALSVILALALSLTLAMILTVGVPSYALSLVLDGRVLCWDAIHCL